MFVVPRGVRHRQVGDKVKIMIIEHESTVYTWDQIGSDKTAEVKDVRSSA